MMCSRQPIPFLKLAFMPVVPFDINSLECEPLLRLFQATTSYVKDVRIEMVVNEKNPFKQEEHPAVMIGLTVEDPIIQFIDSLGREDRIEAVAHELGHLLLVYRFGLGVVGRKIPHDEEGEELLRFYLDMNKNWVYLLGQIANTVHHLILVDYLKGEYGIESHLHLRFLHRHFCMIANDYFKDEESLQAKGLAAFEYEKLLGQVIRVINPYCQSEFLWKAYDSARNHFGDYSASSIPTPTHYAEDIFSFLRRPRLSKKEFYLFPQRHVEFSVS